MKDFLEGLNIKQNISPAEFTTMGTGGPVKYFVEINSEDQLVQLFRKINQESLKNVVIGQGSNIVFPDAGFNGFVIKMGIMGVNVVEENKAALLVQAGAGEIWDDFTAYCVEKEISEIACLSGIPGTVGASPVQNIGAYGKDVAELINSVKVFDTREMRFVDFTNSDCVFSYRNSVFKQNTNLVIVSVEFLLDKSKELEIHYESLKKQLSGKSKDALSVRNTVLELRSKNSTLLDKNDPNTKSTGCFFINPVVKKEVYEKIKNMENFEVPHWEEGFMVKLSAGWLIEHVGFTKGFNYKRTGLSDKHALVIVNKDNASTEEILEFADKITSAVEGKYGVRIGIEPTICC